MKETFFRAASIWVGLVIVGLSCELRAAIFRLDNRPGRPSDLPDLRTALSKAREGDTIYVAGSPFLYGQGKTVEIDTPVCMIGPGYFLSENLPELEATAQSAVIDAVRIGPAAAGFKVQGMSISLLDVDADNVEVRRCRLQELVIGKTVSVTRPFVSQNFFSGDRPVGLALNAIDAVVSNNILWFPGQGPWLISDTPTVAGWERLPATGVFSQNTIVGGVAKRFFDTTRIDFSNNIILFNSESSQAFFLDSYQPDTEDNLIGWFNGEPNAATLQRLFSMEGADDAKLQLGLIAENSARGMGQFGEDLGAFGGSTPYVLSGVPALPSFELFEAQSTVGPTGRLKVRLKAVGGE